jgi:hypothetical protein
MTMVPWHRKQDQKRFQELLSQLKIKDYVEDIFMIAINK